MDNLVPTLDDVCERATLIDLLQVNDRNDVLLADNIIKNNTELSLRELRVLRGDQLIADSVRLTTIHISLSLPATGSTTIRLPIANQRNRLVRLSDGTNPTDRVCIVNERIPLKLNSGDVLDLIVRGHVFMNCHTGIIFGLFAAAIDPKHLSDDEESTGVKTLALWLDTNKPEVTGYTLELQVV